MTTETDPLTAALAREIRGQMARLGMEQQELADKAGMERSTINRYLRLKANMNMATFFRVAEALNLAPSELLRRADEQISASRE